MGSFYGGEKTQNEQKRVQTSFSHLFKNGYIGWYNFASKNLHWKRVEKEILWVRKDVPEMLLWKDSWDHLNAFSHLHFSRIHGTEEAPSNNKIFVMRYQTPFMVHGIRRNIHYIIFLCSLAIAKGTEVVLKRL